AAGAPLGYAAYRAALIVARLVGDGRGERPGRVRVVRLGGTLGALGFVAVAAAPAWPVAVLGLAVTGLGLGVVAPLAFSAVGDRSREAVAAAAGPASDAGARGDGEIPAARTAGGGGGPRHGGGAPGTPPAAGRR